MIDSSIYDAHMCVCTHAGNCMAGNRYLIVIQLTIDTKLHTGLKWTEIVLISHAAAENEWHAWATAIIVIPTFFLIHDIDIIA